MKKAWLKDIKGMWIATYSEGRMIGVVNSIYIDQDNKKVTGFALRPGPVMGGQDIWVEQDQIKKFGEDLILIPNLDSLSENQPKGIKLDQLTGMQVSSKDGRALGQLSDIAVDLDNWIMIEFALNNEKLIEVDVVETVLGKDLILVQAKVATKDKIKEKKVPLVESVFGKEFVKQTSDVLKRVLKGTEGDKPNQTQPDDPSEQTMEDQPPKTNDET